MQDEQWYYEHVRTDIRSLLPGSASRILDVGAGAGGTLRWLKSIYPQSETTGLELNPALYGKLKKNADVAIIGDVDKCYCKLQNYDLILLLDVLEHLADSEGTLKKLVTHLNTGGSVIVSVPNIAHLSVSIPLLFRRQFTYQDSGCLDRTHVRFFVEKTAIELLNHANLNIKKGLITGLKGPRSTVINWLTLGLARHYLAKQYIMVGEITNGKVNQRRIHWTRPVDR